MKFIAILLSMILLGGCTSSSGPERVAFDPEKAQAAASAKVHTELAAMYFERSQMGIALGEIEQALQSDPGYAPAYNMRGLLHMALREDKEAEADFRRSLSLDRDDSEAHNNYGWFLCQRGREKESMPHFMAALKNPLYTTPERAYLNAGLCARRAGNLKDAEEFLQRALAVQPALPQAMFVLAELNFNRGNIQTARKYFSGFADRNEAMTAEQIWLGVRIERSAGNQELEKQYAVQLRKRFPDAPETRSMMSGE